MGKLKRAGEGEDEGDVVVGYCCWVFVEGLGMREGMGGDAAR